MSDTLLELALRKQCLQMRSAALREEWAACVAGVRPLLDGADRVRTAGSWLRRHPEVGAGVGVALLVARPRIAWRWLRRGFAAWRMWRKGQRWLARGESPR